MSHAFWDCQLKWTLLRSSGIVSNRTVERFRVGTFGYLEVTEEYCGSVQRSTYDVMGGCTDRRIDLAQSRSATDRRIGRGDIVRS